MSPRNRKLRKNINDRAPLNAVWITKEGFVVQVRSMTDVHLMHLYMMLVEKVRKAMGPENRVVTGRDVSISIDVESTKRNDFSYSGYSAPLKPKPLPLAAGLAHYDSLAHAIDEAGHPVLRFVINELRHRKLIDKLPATF